VTGPSGKTGAGVGVHQPRRPAPCQQGSPAPAGKSRAAGHLAAVSGQGAARENPRREAGGKPGARRQWHRPPQANDRAASREASPHPVAEAPGGARGSGSGRRNTRAEVTSTQSERTRPPGTVARGSAAGARHRASGELEPSASTPRMPARTSRHETAGHRASGLRSGRSRGFGAGGRAGAAPSADAQQRTPQGRGVGCRERARQRQRRKKGCGAGGRERQEAGKHPPPAPRAGPATGATWREQQDQIPGRRRGHAAGSPRGRRRRKKREPRQQQRPQGGTASRGAREARAHQRRNRLTRKDVRRTAPGRAGRTGGGGMGRAREVSQPQPNRRVEPT